MRKRRWALTTLVLLATAAPARAQTSAPNRPRLGFPGRAPSGAPPELGPESQEAIARGLDYLAHAQRQDGSWTSGEYPIAVASLCGLAFLGGGSTPSAGPYAGNVAKAMSFLLRNQRRSGLFFYGADSRPMYGHGFALLFLAECAGTCGSDAQRRELDRAIRDAIRLVSSVQTEDGGWYYTPTREEDEGSVTISQIQGLRAARDAGFRVERSVIDRAVSYIRRSQERDGGIRYTARYGRSSLALTAAGLGVLFGAGDYDSKNVAAALEYVRAHLDTGPDTPHFHYTQFYLSQAMFQQGGLDWEAYFPRVRAELMRTRAGDGSWASTYGRPYATALSLLILEIPYRYLPIYER